jgi:hypothetical protein
VEPGKQAYGQEKDFLDTAEEDSVWPARKFTLHGGGKEGFLADLRS